MKKQLVSIILVCPLLCISLFACAEEIVITRSVLAFPEAMLALHESIRAHGYTVSRVQRIDIGLTGMGYKTDKYRIVFAGKIDEIRELTKKNIAIGGIYFPLKRLEKKELIEAYQGKPTAVRGGQSKRYYRLTKRGLEALLKMLDIQQAFWKDLPDLEYLENEST